MSHYDQQIIELKVINSQVLEVNEDELFYNKEVCPICGRDELIIQGRCTTCSSCGWSMCSV